MRITVVAQGTRGDVQPMLALSKGLQAAGYTVRLCGGSNFEGWVRSHGIDYIPTINMEALMQSEAGVEWTEGSANPMKQLRMMRELLDAHGMAMVRPIAAAAPATDLFISGFVSEPFVQSISETAGVPYINAALQPYRPSVSGAASLTALAPRGTSPFNRLIGQMSERMIWGVAANTTNALRRELNGNLKPHNASSYTRASRRAPLMVGISPQVLPHPADWQGAVAITGYWFLDEETGWTPAPDLLRFLEAGTPPVYIGFGSMASSAPEATLRLILEVLRQTGQRAVIGSGWGGVGADSLTLPETVYLLDHAPHSWLFPRMAAVIHHGGAGTTAAGLRAGKPTLIIPHMSDQPYWGRRVHDLGVGVKPIPRHKLTADGLAAGIRTLVTDAGIQSTARQIGERIRAEPGIENAVAFVRQHQP